MGNAAFNPLSALTGATMVAICAHSPSRALVAEIMRETLAVAEALGCTPQVSIEQRLAGAEQVGEHKTSMLQDLEAGRPLELDPIVTAVIELAELTRVDVPALRAVHAATDLLDRTRRGAPAPR
jgi:2-dehydropantoate 2-reductase